MTTGNKIGIVAVIILTLLIVTPLVIASHRNANTVHPNQVVQPAASQTLAPEQAAQAQRAARGFLEAIRNADWSAVAKYWPSDAPAGKRFEDALTDSNRKLVAGMEILSIGAPHKESPDSWILVPYAVRFTNGNGETNELRLGQEQDGQWHWEGGF
jgi:hypothetical protein